LPPATDLKADLFKGADADFSSNSAIRKTATSNVFWSGMGENIPVIFPSHALFACWALKTQQRQTYRILPRWRSIPQKIGRVQNELSEM
jgi:hypothetical protein